MKKDLIYLVIAIIVIVAIGIFIDADGRSATKPLRARVINGRADDQYHIIEIEGCEYVVWREYQKGGITHKGNCKNHK
jgi:hypothetical protein